MTAEGRNVLRHGIGRYLGRPVSDLLSTHPFAEWKFGKSLDSDGEAPVLEYVFDGHGLELQCDLVDRVTVIFLHSEEYAGFDSCLSGIPFSLTREEVRQQFGEPSRSGGPITDDVLGDCGAWDRFENPEFRVHFEYRVCSPGINKITLMANDVVPRK